MRILWKILLIASGVVLILLTVLYAGTPNNFHFVGQDGDFISLVTLVQRTSLVVQAGAIALGLVLIHLGISYPSKK